MASIGKGFANFLTIYFNWHLFCQIKAPFGVLFVFARKEGNEKYRHFAEKSTDRY